MADTDTCTNSQLDEVGEVISAAAVLVKEILAEVEKLQAKSDACEDNSCFKGILIEGGKLVLVLPVRIVKETIRVNNQIGKITVALGKCLTANNIEIAKQIPPFVVKVAECIGHQAT